MKFFSKILNFFGLRQDIGSRAERVAFRYLKKSKNFRLLCRNYRFSRYEIDIVCYDKTNDCIVFVEVKTRPTYARVQGYYAATSKHKKECLKKCANAFLRKNSALDKNYRFDVVEVEHDENGKFVNINHFEA